jgi:hypothetical protein
MIGMKRDVFVAIRLTQQEHQALNSFAQFEGVSVSEATRQLIHDRCQREGFYVGMVAASENHKESEAKK